MFALQGMFGSTSVTIGDIAADRAKEVRYLARLDRFTAISTFAAMMVIPNLQANAYRLEALVHLSLASCSGQQNASPKLVRKLFKRFGRGVCGRMEDPAEDLFTTAVHCQQGNFVVLEGLREGNGFYLQRVLDALEKMPSREPFAGMRRSVFALLVLSDAVARRAGLYAGERGWPEPLDDLPMEVLNNLPTISAWVRFSAQDPELSHIDLKDLEPFVFDQDSSLLQEALTDSSLERQPILRFGDLICLALPVAVGTAIPLYVSKVVESLGKTHVLEKSLALSYWELLAGTSFMPKRQPPLSVAKDNKRLLAGSVLAEVDSGRYFHLLVINQPLDGLATAGFSSPCTASMELSHESTEAIAEASAFAHAQSDFREGLTLIVSCGLGQASLFFGEAPPPQWHIKFLPVHDAITMAWTEGFQLLDLFRMAEAESVVASAGIRLVNCNGLLSLWAWADDFKGHLIPHGDLPEEFRATDGPRMIVVKQNALLALRHEVQARTHTFVARNVEGDWRRVRRLADSIFLDDLQAPVYMDEAAIQSGALKTVYVADSRYWWATISSDREDRPEIFENWKMLYTWLIRFALVLDSALRDNLPSALEIHVHFERMADIAEPPVQIPSTTVLQGEFRPAVDSQRSTIHLNIGKAFNDALASPDNLAERSLVGTIVRTVYTLAEVALNSDEQAALVASICPSHHARSRHMMPAHTFRDMIQHGVSSPVQMHRMDDATARVGIAFRVQPNVGGEIVGIRECTAFLNEAARRTLQEICALLQPFNRRLYIEALLMLHENAAIRRDQWRRTAHANVALHGESAVQTVSEHIAEMTACMIACRLLIEAAVCECPVDGGLRPGNLDISRAMARALFAFNIGGWSDAMHWGAIAAKVRITPIGDIHVDHTFMEAVSSPFAQAGGKREVQEAVKSYKKAYSEPEPVKAVADLIESAFLDAWEAEFGVSVDALRAFADALENVGVEKNELWFELHRSELMVMLGECSGRDPSAVAVTVDLLTLPARVSWLMTPPGFRDKDWHPWKFRRRLSLVRRPFIQLDSCEDPKIMVAPAIVRDGFYILLRSYHSGETPDWQVSSRAMRKWLGHTNNVTRTAFNSAVSDKLRGLGWKSDSDYRITRLLGFPLDRDYGDVDALAWDPESGRVLAIECKDLHFHKTLGEVAEQLSDFQGGIKADGKRDLLRKHLDRLSVMEQHKVVIAKRLRLRGEIQIEGYVVFKNPVPMEFAWAETQPQTKALLESQLETLKLHSS